MTRLMVIAKVILFVLSQDTSRITKVITLCAVLKPRADSEYKRKPESDGQCFALRQKHHPLRDVTWNMADTLIHKSSAYRIVRLKDIRGI